MQKFYQLSLSDIFEDCKDLFDNNKNELITLFEQIIDFAEYSYRNLFSSSVERESIPWKLLSLPLFYKKSIQFRPIAYLSFFLKPVRN